jgi:hypothetical protein
MSVNDPTIELGDPTAVRTVNAAATTGATTLTLDTVSNISAGDAISGTGIAGGTTVTGFPSGTSISLSAAITADIDAGDSITITRTGTDALDRGVKVHYDGQFAFFGFDRTGGADGNGAWTFIEDASDTNGVFGVTGDRGTVVLGDLELDTDLEVQYGGTGVSTFTTNGILYGNSTGALQVTAAANISSPGSGNDITTSYQILTVTAAGVPVWTNTIDGGTF